MPDVDEREDNIKSPLKKVNIEAWIFLIDPQQGLYLAMRNAITKFHVSSNTGNFLTKCTTATGDVLSE